MRPVSHMLMCLNVETRVHHAAADEPLLELVRPDVRRLDYMHLLVRMYGFEAALEGACAYTPRLHGLLDLRVRTRSGLIVRDLLALGLAHGDLSRLAHCPALTTFHDAPEAIGWMYVTERATLLHDGVRRNLLARLPGVADACAYFSASTGSVGERWNELGIAVDRISPQGDRIVAAAHEAFACLRGWLSRSEADLKAAAN
jgi:heme oxygenase (biliverdin-IX-beta and delta-forming)